MPRYPEVTSPYLAHAPLLIRIFPYFSDLRIPVHLFEEPVDVDRAPPFCESDVLLGCQCLLTEKHDAVVVECLSYLFEGVVIQVGEVNIPDFDTECRGYWFEFHGGPLLLLGG